MTGVSKIVAIDADGLSPAPENTPDAEHGGDAVFSTESWGAPEPDYADHSQLQTQSWLIPALALVAVAAWSGFFGWAQLAFLQTGITPLQGIALVRDWALPVLLIAVAWLLIMRTSRREARRFGEAAQLLNTESSRLETRLATVNGELSLAREFIAAQSRDLDLLGRSAVERISEHADRLATLVQDNFTRIDAIGSVSEAALDNMERLRGHLPVIASSAKDVTNQIGNAGRTADVQLQELTSGFDRLSEFGQSTERQVAALRKQIDAAIAEFTVSTQAMAAHAADRLTALRDSSNSLLDGIESGQAGVIDTIRERSTTLAAEISEARIKLDSDEAESLASLRSRLTAVRDESTAIARAMHGAEAATTNAWQATSARLETDLRAVLERIEALDSNATDSARKRLQALFAEAQEIDTRLAERDRQFAEYLGQRESETQARHAAALDQIGGQFVLFDEQFAARRAEHDEYTRNLTEHGVTIAAQMATLSSELGAIADHGSAAEQRLTGSLDALSDRLNAGREALAGTDIAVASLTDSSVRLLELIQASAQHSQIDLPAAIAVGDAHLAELETRSLTMKDAVEAAAARGSDLTEQLIEGRTQVAAAQSELLDLHAALAERTAAQSTELDEMRKTLTALGDESERLTGHVQQELGGAITTLRTAAQQSFGELEAMSADSIHAMAERLGDESSVAIERALRIRVAEAVGQLDEATAHASGVSREAALQLRDQLRKIDELTGNLEQRVTRARERAEEQIDHDFARRVALITESLNSNAIDIARALDTDVSDTAWASYLKGDRGVFTRRAVKLLEPAEAKAVAQVFGNDSVFREHVSRYIHDFEAMLRQLLSTRDGHALGVTLLSSDMGKLYVALAQSIERLRN